MYNTFMKFSMEGMKKGVDKAVKTTGMIVGLGAAVAGGIVAESTEASSQTKKNP